MKIQTRYSYEKTWTLTQENDLLKIIEEETGSSEAARGTLVYIKEVVKNGKEITVGTCKFRLQQ